MLFSSARAVLKWLGLTATKDVRRLLCRSQKMRDGVKVTRVLGGLQWNTEGVQDPIRVFVGTSCVGHRRATDEPCGTQEPVIQFESGRWDCSNQRMAAVPAGNRAKVGTYNHARDCHSVFSLSWVWTGGYDGRAVSAHVKKTGYVRLGKLTLNMPMVTFRGNELRGWKYTYGGVLGWLHVGAVKNVMGGT